MIRKDVSWNDSVALKGILLNKNVFRTNSDGEKRLVEYYQLTGLGGLHDGSPVPFESCQRGVRETAANHGWLTISEPPKPGSQLLDYVTDVETASELRALFEAVLEECKPQEFELYIRMAIIGS